MQPESRSGRGSDRLRRAAGMQKARPRNYKPRNYKPRETGAAASEEAAAAALTVQLLGFIAEGRTYGETMEAWRSTCPRMPVWENAVRDGLVRIENGGAMKSSRVVLTAKGSARLHGNAHPQPHKV